MVYLKFPISNNLVVIIDNKIECAKALAASIEDRCSEAPLVFSSLEEYMLFRSNHSMNEVTVRLFITDVEKDGRSLYEVCSNLEIENLKSVADRVMILNEYDTSESIENAVSFGANELMTKPIGFHEFVFRALLLLDSADKEDKNSIVPGTRSDHPTINNLLVSVDGEVFNVTKTESLILRAIIESSFLKKSLSRVALEKMIWGVPRVSVQRKVVKALDVHLCSLRKKLAICQWTIDFNHLSRSYSLRKLT